jgi:hypothetical protein
MLVLPALQCHDIQTLLKMGQGRSFLIHFVISTAVVVQISSSGLHQSGNQHFRSIFCRHLKGQSIPVTSTVREHYGKIISWKSAVSRLQSNSTPSILTIEEACSFEKLVSYLVQRSADEHSTCLYSVVDYFLLFSFTVGAQG